MFPDEPNDEERLEEVDNDGGATPFNAADDVPDEPINDTHQATDTGVQPEEVYYDGAAAATNLAEPNAGSDVLSYNPQADQRQSSVGNI